MPDSPEAWRHGRGGMHFFVDPSGTGTGFAGFLGGLTRFAFLLVQFGIYHF